MSSTLTRSVLRITRHASPRVRLTPAPFSAQRLHTSVRRWEEAKLAAQAEPVSTASATTSTKTAAALEHAETEVSAPSHLSEAAAAETTDSATATRPSEEATAPEVTDSPTSGAASETWTRAGVHPAVVEKLVQEFPSIKAPTPAQLAFLLTIQHGKADVFFKDFMGRGKTFSVVLAALSLVLSGKRAMILVPTPHLARQVEDLCLRLLEVTQERGIMWNVLTADTIPEEVTEPLVISTPKIYLQSGLDLRPDWVLIDEPDAMLGPLPPRHIEPERLAQHPIYRHPPPLTKALDHLFDIPAAPERREVRGKRQRERERRSPALQERDLSRRRAIRTAWCSATLQSKIKNYAFRHGWSRQAADLNWTPGASEGQLAARESIEAIAAQIGVATDASMGVRPQHYLIEVSATGALRPVSQADVEEDKEEYERAPWQGSSEPRPPWQYVPEEEGEDVDETRPLHKDSPVFTEAVALLQTLAPPPDGKYALILPPGRVSLTAIADELDKLGVASAPLVPEAIAAGIPPPRPGTNPVIIASRESLTGIHLPELHTVYLINGLDVGSMSKQQRVNGGRLERGIVYQRITGRLGRLGTNVEGKPQRVISLLPVGKREMRALTHTLDGMGEELATWEDVDLSKH